MLRSPVPKEVKQKRSSSSSTTKKKPTKRCRIAPQPTDVQKISMYPPQQPTSGALSLAVRLALTKVHNDYMVRRFVIKQLEKCVIGLEMMIELLTWVKEQVRLLENLITEV